VIDRVEDVWRLSDSACLRDKNLAFADLRGQCLWGADMENTILFGADLRGCDFTKANLRNANLAYARVEGASFCGAILDGTDLLYTGVKCSQLESAIITPASTIPGVKVVW
jgi:uncharacterized protein YjbI with pentapeptide repeats